MTAAVLDGIGEPLRIRQVDVAAPGPGEVLVRVGATGICHSDLTAVEIGFGEPLPLIPGHEVAGEVVELGAGVQGLAEGDHVVVCEVSSCGYCPECRRGRPQLCRTNALHHGPGAAPSMHISFDGQPVHRMAGVGGFAEYVLVDSSVLARIPKDVPFDRAAVLGCAVATGAGAAINTAGVRVGDTVAVIGCGGVGLNTIQGARLAGAREIIAIDVVPSKLEMAKRFGATAVIDASSADVVAEVRALTDGLGVTYAFDVAGHGATERQAYDLVARGGTCLLVGIPRPGTRFELDVLGDMFDLNRVEVAVRPVFMGSTNVINDIPLYAELYRQGRWNLDDLVAHRLGIVDIEDGFERLRRGDLARAVITEFSPVAAAV